MDGPVRLGTMVSEMKDSSTPGLGNEPFRKPFKVKITHQS